MSARFWDGHFAEGVGRQSILQPMKLCRNFHLDLFRTIFLSVYDKRKKEKAEEMNKKKITGRKKREKKRNKASTDY